MNSYKDHPSSVASELLTYRASRHAEEDAHLGQTSPSLCLSQSAEKQITLKQVLLIEVSLNQLLALKLNCMF
jgi:hypothetical protein